MDIDWVKIREKIKADPRQFFRFWGTGAAGIMAVFLVFWMWNDPPVEPGAAGRAFVGVLLVAIAAPPIVWLIRAGKSD